MSDRSAWLGLNLETAIEPELPICDAHHHLWIYPDSRYLVDEFLADTGGGHRVEKTVFVECLMFHRLDGPPELRPVGETIHVDRMSEGTQASGTQVAAGIVGFADLRLGDAVQAVLEAHVAASVRFRGVRYASAWDASDTIHAAHTRPPAGLLADTRFRDGLKCVERSGLAFDAWIYFTQLPELVNLASHFPTLTIVLDHVGGPIGIGPYSNRRAEVFAIWKAGMKSLAARPNVVVKLGGFTMTMAGFGWHKLDAPPSSIMLADAMRPYVHTCIELFGVERCMFESNFPMDRASCAYTTLWNAFKRVSADLGPVERQALLHDTATRVYRL